MHSTKRSNHDLAPPHPPTIRISIDRIYFNDILMGRFVISQTPGKKSVVQTTVVRGS